MLPLVFSYKWIFSHRWIWNELDVDVEVEWSGVNSVSLCISAMVDW
jgi:hypothetical protein